ncbi:hypothetical protein [Pantoea sp. PSNIH1]|jgi:hypothetical protein|nr:hypothetical protein [Pantoea sp. PSNIH1]
MATLKELMDRLTPERRARVKARAAELRKEIEEGTRRVTPKMHPKAD